MLIIVILVGCLTDLWASAEIVKFPDNLLFGVATSAYQIEGAWNEDGKGPSIWDAFSHKHPSPIAGADTGDVACDSYHRYKEDIALAASLGSDFYRFSIAWSRVLPDGYANKINQKGIDYYKDVVKEIVRNRMLPVVTLYHWDLPQRLFEDGVDWRSEKLVSHFVNFARIIFKNLPSVAIWTTINEPKLVCRFAYGMGLMAPGIHSSGLEEYQCSYILLKVHAATYHMYKTEFRHYKAKLGLVIDAQWAEPKTNKPSDITAAERQRQFENGLYLHPMVHGGWPKVVCDRIRQRSLAENYTKSRLPCLSKQEINFIKGTYDYIAINHYITYLVEDDKEAPYSVTGWDSDVRVINSMDPTWKLTAYNWPIVPWGVRKLLNWIRNKYGDNDIMITEIGCADDGRSLNDKIRIDFYREYFCNILAAIYFDRIRVTAITGWSLMDNFEWAAGYSMHFGMFAVDFTTMKRTPKKSVQFWQEMTKTKTLNCEGDWSLTNQTISDSYRTRFSFVEYLSNFFRRET